jgi:alpha-galactosidase
MVANTVKFRIVREQIRLYHVEVQLNRDYVCSKGGFPHPPYVTVIKGVNYMRCYRIVGWIVGVCLLGSVYFLRLGDAPVETRRVNLSALDLLKVEQGRGYAQPNRTILGKPFSIGGQSYGNGVGTHSPSVIRIALDGKTRAFTARVGVDDEAKAKGCVVFRVIGDDQELYSSGDVTSGESPRLVEVDLVGVRQLLLLVEPDDDETDGDHADWVEAIFSVAGETPCTVDAPQEEAVILTPPSAPAPRINSPKVFGVRPGSPVLYTIAATGTRPMIFNATGLPDGLSVDTTRGHITGMVKQKGTYPVTLTAQNALARTERILRIEVGDTLALTPPMGWNSWNCWGCAVDQERILASARALVETGLINHGWSYVNIDDCWMVKPNSPDPLVNGPARDEQGLLRCNRKFPDMAGLTRALHEMGLKAGIYTSPGPATCQGYEGSYGHEMQDAVRFSLWGFDYLKYDWCAYSDIETQRDRPALTKPYHLMKTCLDRVERDIVYSICQYGMGQVWQWGREVGGNCWRTTGDITDTWDSVSSIGFSQGPYSAYAGPGHWNDPDMLVLGQVGWGPSLHQTRLTPNEQYTHMSLWCLLCAPLLLGCDLTQLDDFTLSLLTNDDVLEVNQDPLGQQAQRLTRQGYQEVWAKEMEDGSLAAGLFNRSEFPERVTVRWGDLKITGSRRVHDLWRQVDLGQFTDAFTAKVPRHGVVLVRISAL